MVYDIHRCLSVIIVYIMIPAANNDYSSRTYPVQFEAGAFTTTVSVPIIDDTFWEPDEIFYGNLTKIGNQNVQITQDTAEVLIKDNDGKRS